MLNRRRQIKNRVILSISFVLLSTLFCFAALPAYAISEEKLEFFAQNNIIFYNPDEPEEITYSPQDDSQKESVLGNFDLLDQIIQDFTTSSSIHLQALIRHYQNTKVDFSAPWQFLAVYSHPSLK